MSERWIKLYEKIEHSSIYRDSELVHLWVHLLIKAQKFRKSFPWNDSEMILEPGQLLTGRKRLAVETGISESKIQRALNRYEKCHMIEQQTTNKYRVISILNWAQYQDSEQQTNSKRTGNEQVTNNERTGNEHIQERKKERKEKEEKREKPVSVLKPEEVTEQTWADFITHRKAKKAPVTQTVVNKIASQSKKAGWSIEEVLQEMVSRGWVGFSHEWVNKKQDGSQYDFV